LPVLFHLAKILCFGLKQNKTCGDFTMFLLFLLRFIAKQNIKGFCLVNFLFCLFRFVVLRFFIDSKRLEKYGYYYELSFMFFSFCCATILSALICSLRFIVNRNMNFFRFVSLIFFSIRFLSFDSKRNETGSYLA